MENLRESFIDGLNLEPLEPDEPDEWDTLQGEVGGADATVEIPMRVDQGGDEDDATAEVVVPIYLDEAATAEINVVGNEVNAPNELEETIIQPNELSFAFYLAEIFKDVPEISEKDDGEKLVLALAIVCYFRDQELLDFKAPNIKEQFESALLSFLYHGRERTLSKKSFARYLVPLRKALYPHMPVQRLLRVSPPADVDTVLEAVCDELIFYGIPFRQARIGSCNPNNKSVLPNKGDDIISASEDGLVLFPLDCSSARGELSQVMQDQDSVAIYTLPEEKTAIPRGVTNEQLSMVIDIVHKPI